MKTETKNTLVLSLALTSPDNQPAYELSQDEATCCNLLTVGHLDEETLVDAVRKLFQTAKESGLLNEPYTPCLFAGRLEVV